MNVSDVIDERYRVERLLGTGGMSEVWLAEDERLGRWVAVKLLRDSVADEQDGDLATSLEREARLIARLQHPNIVSVYDVGRHEGRHYLVMEYVHGNSLRQLLEARGRRGEAEVVRYGTQIASALAYAHEQGVIHCDIKPENILVTEQGVAKAVDFGVAETVTRTLTADQARDVLGTIAYLAPEVIQGAPADARSDIYSLGLTLYELVAGRLPFAGTTPAAIAGQRLAGAAPPLRAFAREASPELESVLARALALSQDDRYQTAAEFGAALRRAPAAGAAQRPPQRPAVAVGAPPPPVRRRRDTARLSRRDTMTPPPPEGLGGAAIGAIIAAVALALGLGVVAAILLTRDDDAGGGSDTPTPTPTVEQNEAPTPTTQATAEPTATPTPTESPTETPTPTPTTEATATPTPTEPATPTPSPSATPTESGGSGAALDSEEGELGSES